MEKTINPEPEKYLLLQMTYMVCPEAGRTGFFPEWSERRATCTGSVERNIWNGGENRKSAPVL